MNILLINHYAGSPEMGMEFRPYYMAREWVKAGHQVNIIAADYSHLRRVNPEVSEDFQLQVIDGINYFWVKTSKYGENGGKRALTLGQFIGKLMRKSKSIVKAMEPDVVICSSTYPLDTYVGQKMKKASNKPLLLIHEVHDMWPLSPIELGGMSPKHPFIRVMQRAEDSFCKKSDVVVSLLPAAKDYFVEHGMSPEKFVHISNGVVFEEWTDYQQIPEDVAKHFNEVSNKGMLNLCFFGSIHKTSNLEALIDAVIARGKKDVFVTFIGPGHEKEEIKGMTKGHEDQFAFFDPIPKKSVPDLFNYIDCSFAGSKSQGLLRFGMCMNKIFDSMMGAKPMFCTMKTPNNYVKDYDAGIVVEENTREDIIAGLDKLMALTPEERQKMGENGHKAAMEVFNYQALSKKFLDVMEENLAKISK